MAIKKSFELSDGSSAEYIRIRQLVQTKLDINITLDLYKSKADRDAGKSPSKENFMAKKFPNLPERNFELSDYGANAYEEAYTFLKSLEEFDGAEDE